MVSRLLKSYFIRIRLWVTAKLIDCAKLLSAANVILSLAVMGSLVYAFGFRNDFNDALNIGLFKVSFFMFYIEHCVFFISNLARRKMPVHWYYPAIFFLLMTTVMVIGWIPQNYIDNNILLHYIHHKHTLFLLVGIQAILKFSISLTSSLSNKLSPNWIFVGSFMILILFGLSLLLLPNATHNGISFLDALFTAVSAVCVTGLTTVDVPSTFTFTGELIILGLIQLGGIGIMTFTSFFGLMFAGSHASQNKMLIKDLIDPDKGISQIFSTLRNIIFLTFIIEALGAWSIYSFLDDRSFHGMYIAVFHSISAFCNAGFSIIPDGLNNASIVNNYAILNSIAFLVIIGGLGFPLLFNLWKWLKTTAINAMRKLFGKTKTYVHTPRIISSNSVIIITITIILLTSGTIIFFVTEYDNILEGKTLWGKLCTAFFMSVTPRTAGFNAFDMGSLMPITLTFMIIYMWIGGSPMSTAGGVKTTTLGIAMLNIWNTLRGRDNIEIRHRSLSHQTVNRAFIIIFVSLAVIATGVCLISIFDPDIQMQHILFEVVSAFSTVGLSVNITPVLTDYSHIVLIVLMFIGRIGLLSLLSCFITKENKSMYYNYPTEDILIN